MRKPKKPVAAATTSQDGPSEDKESSDFDFKETLKSVLLLILNRLVTALEYEQEGFLDLAQKRSKKNYLELLAPQHFEKVLRDSFDLDAVKPADPDLERSDPSYEQQRFFRILEACEKAPFRPGVTRDKFVQAVQKATKETQKELRDSAIQSQSSDLKIHLLFFAKALDVVTGDIVNHPELLYSNIDDICEPK
jgi:hypothetical protein